MRKLKNLCEVEREFELKVWYDRHQMTIDKNKKNGTPKDIVNGAIKAAKSVEKEFGKKNLGPYTEFEWGMLNGKLSAIRWVLGEDWDMLDT